MVSPITTALTLPNLDVFEIAHVFTRTNKMVPILCSFMKRNTLKVVNASTILFVLFVSNKIFFVIKNKMEARKKFLLAAIYSVYILKPKKKRKQWHKDWLGDYQRLTNSFAFKLEPLIFKNGATETRNYIRVDSEVYFDILEKLSDLIERTTTNMRNPITPREKLSLTLSYLAEGNKKLKFRLVFKRYLTILYYLTLAYPVGAFFMNIE